MKNVKYLLEKPEIWSLTALYQPNRINYPLITLPQVIYKGNVYTYTGISTIGTTPDNDPKANITYSFKVLSYLLLTGLNITPIANGAISLASATQTKKSDDISINPNTKINLPLNSIYNVQIALNITSSASSGATFSIVGTDCTVTSQSIVVTASKNENQYILNAIVSTSTTVGNPTISLSASNVTGTVSINNNTSITLNRI